MLRGFAASRLFLLWGLAAGPWLVPVFLQSPEPAEEPLVILIGGDADGYLAPCGCTKPMSGGIRRRVAAARAATGPGRTIVLESGGLVAGSDRQDELKAETLAESLHRAGVNAIGVGLREAELGSGTLRNVDALSGNRLVLSQVAADLGWIRPEIVAGPLRIGAIEPREAELADRFPDLPLRSASVAVEELIAGAALNGEISVLMVRGGIGEARDLAERFPELELVVYRSGGAPPAPELIGNTWLVSPGEKGKYLVRLERRGDRWANFEVLELGPEVEEDAMASEIFATYLDRLRSEALLERRPRLGEAGYVGSQACMSCHAESYRIWKGTSHATALATLEQEGHDRDPDCVSCHVVGLDHEDGFRSRDLTEDLADVGCESCHGPGAAHLGDPFNILPPKLSPESCMSCHNANHSPGFSYEAYWPLIAH